MRILLFVTAFWQCLVGIGVGPKKGCHIFTYVAFANKPNAKEQPSLIRE
jgi:hypothetical protein